VIPSIPRVKGYHYDVQQIYLSVLCSLKGSTGFRGVARIFDNLQPVLEGFAVAHSTLRVWMLKVGLHLLEREKDQNQQWVYIIDASIQMGDKKCLLVVGIPLSRLQMKGDYTISHTDLEPLVVKTIASCKGEVVKEALLEAERKTGVPFEILSDEGAEMKYGVHLYKESGRNVIYHHDIVHKIDKAIKKDLQQDERWKKFTSQMLNTTQKLKLSEWAYLIPPKQRQKNRMLSEKFIVKWGEAVIQFLDRHANDLDEVVEANLGWVRDYRTALIEYRSIFEISAMVIYEVREKGYQQNLSVEVENKCKMLSQSKRGRSFWKKIKEILVEEEKKVPEGMRTVGSSESIESIFGKFKQLEKYQASNGLTSLVLSIPAMLGQLTMTVVAQAMSRISIKKLLTWVETNLGKTFCSRRREGLGGGRYLDLDDSQSCIC
jgi:hypothetical protein